MKNPQIEFRKEINEIKVTKNEFLTLWVQDGDGDSFIQVELRVTPEGRPEIYTDILSIVKTFREWYNIE